MADKRISQLIERTDILNNDVLPIVASGATTTNKVTISTIQDWMQDNLDVGVTSVGITLGTSGNDVNVTGSPITTSGNITINIPTATATIRGLLSPSDFSTFNNKLSSVGLSMPSAFVVSNSPLTANGTIAVTGAGTVSQYIRGDGSLADFPEAGGGGSSVSYYLNGSVSQGTIGGVAYREMNKTPILGAGTDFTIAADGYIASFITDAGDPGLLEIPGGNWNFETYFQASSGGGTPSFYIELYKVSYPGNTATLIASNSANPELIAFGTTTTAYFSSLAVPTTTLALTDRLAIRYYVTHSGRTITLHTENSNLCQIITTFTTGLTALNGLTAQVQNFATGTSGTDFSISSTGSTHTFNIPTASATNRGLLSSADFISFSSDKVPYSGATGTVNLGVHQLQAGSVYIQGTSPTSGSNIGFKHSTSVTTGADGMTSMYTFGTNIVGFQSISGATTKDFSFSMVGITPGVPGGRVYNLPDASGTLALTSDLGNYVTIGTTQTITGSKTISNSTTTFMDLNSTNANGASLNFQRNGVNIGHIGNSGVLGVGVLDDLEVRAGSTRALHLKTDGGQLTLASGGAVTLTGALNGTSASFSGAVNSDGRFASVTNQTAPSDGSAYFYKSSSGAVVSGFQFLAETGGAGSRSTKLTIDSTGAATFSSSVSVKGGLTIVRSNTSESSVISNEGNLIYNARDNFNHVFQSNGTEVARINTAGAATFSSSVTAGDGLIINDGNGIPIRIQDISAAISGQTAGYIGMSTSAFSGNNGDLVLYPRTSVDSRILLMGGNVGIGTTSPEELLDIRGANRDETSAQYNQVIYSTSTHGMNRGGSIGLGGTTNGTSSITAFGAIKGGKENDTAGNTAGVLSFLTRVNAGPITEKMRITSGGAVAIGATSTNGRLGVRGTTNDSSAYAFEAANSSGNTLFIVRNDGNVGIGAVPSYQLQLSTDSAAKPSTNTWTIASDERVKENVNPYTKGLDVIMEINPVTYDYNGKAGFEKIKDNVGVIAQEIKDIMPESISTYKAKLNEEDEEETELFNFNSHALTYVLINAIKELKAEIEALKSQING